MAEHDYRSVRFGLNPPASVVDLRSHATLDLLAAYGVPAVLVDPKAPGQAQREGWRIFVNLTLSAIGRIIAAQLGPALGVPDLALDFRAARASDAATLARAYRSLRDAGMEDGPAREVVGL